MTIAQVTSYCSLSTMSFPYRGYFNSSARGEVVADLEKIADAVVDLLFNEENRDLRVFLFLDDDEQQEISNRLALSTSLGFEEYLGDRLRKLPTSDSSLEVLDIMWHATNRWRANGDFLATPPAIPLLLLFSYAARAMGEGERPAHAYYVHLQQRLNLTNQDDLQKKYASKLSLNLWTSLQEWLDAWQDERGISTVVFPDQNLPPNRKYIRMAESQAILRSHDRENLGKMFSHYNLDSSMPVPESIMTAMIDGWTSLSMCSRRLKITWKRKETHRAIVVGALAHLAKWSPQGTDGTTEGISLGLTAIPTKRTGNVDLFLDVRTKRPLRDPTFEILAHDGGWKPFSVFGLEALRLRVDSISSITTEAKLQQVIQGRVTSKGVVTGGKRNPRSIVPLLRQPTQQYTESSSVLLGLPHALLIRTDRIPTLFDRIEMILQDHADAGWRVLPPNERKNLPSNWEFIDNVKFIKLVDPSLLQGSGVEIFEMVKANVIDFSGGQKIPGRMSRWLVSHPPCISGTFPGNDVTHLRLVGESIGKENPVIREDKISDGFVRMDLSTETLEPGSYSLIAISHKGDERSHGDLQLCSPNEPDPFAQMNRRPLATAVGRSNPKGFTTSDPLPPLPAGTHLEGMYLNGAIEPRAAERHPVPDRLPDIVRGSNNPTSVHPMQLANQSPPECAFASHYWILESEIPEKTREEDLGRCKHCHREQGHSRTGTKKVLRPLKGIGSTPRSPAVKEERTTSTTVPERPQIPTDENWNAAFDSLCFLIQGSFKDFQTVTAHVTPGALASSSFWKNLFLLGHIEMQCDDLYHPQRWFVNPPTLTLLSPEHGFFSGLRSKQVKADIEAALAICDYQLCVEPQSGFVDYWFAEPRDLNTADARRPLSDVVFPDEIGMRIADEIPSKLVRSLAHLSTVRDGLRKVKIYGSESQMWNPRSRKWSSTSETHLQGGFQTTGFAVSYFFNKDRLGLDDYSTLATYDLVKHLSAHQIGEPICAYVQSEQNLIVPRGAELPRLYGRVAAACSGRLPDSIITNGINILIYRDVPLEVAESIYHLLLS